MTAGLITSDGDGAGGSLDGLTRVIKAVELDFDVDSGRRR